MFSFILAVIYVCFISLGLPDSLLGSAWPTIYKDLDVPFSFAGIISALICLCTIISSLFSDKLTKKFSSGTVTCVSILLTATALIGFSISTEFWMLILFAIPYGLGAGGVDAALNNYVALNYESKHMSWLHAMWGVGATISPYIMGYALTNGAGWNQGYLIVSIIQITICLIVFFTLPKWKGNKKEEEKNETKKSLKLIEVMKIPGAISSVIMFFAYCALEQSAMLWASSYLVQNNNIKEEVAAILASMFAIGITLGRFINGFLTLKLSDKKLIKLGLFIVVIGVVLMFIPLNLTTIIGFILIGLGCAPIYPSIIRLTPELFGEENSQAMIGVQMACAYLGVLLMPPLFGVLADNFTISLLPIYLSIILILMILMNYITNKKAVK
jgi:MFS family permease